MNTKHATKIELHWLRNDGRLYIKKKRAINGKWEWRWSLKATNGKIVGASTEGFSSRAALIKNISSVLTHLEGIDPKMLPV